MATERIGSYPKIYQLGHNATLDILKYKVVVQEKVDGSQFSAQILNGKLIFRSKGQQIHPEAPPKLFKLAVETMQNKSNELHEGWVYRCEAITSVRHNTIKYDRIPAGGVIVYDIDTGQESFLEPAEVQKECERTGLEFVPTFMYSDNVKIDELKPLLGVESCLGGAKIEGVVVKAYGVYGTDKKTLMAKLVRSDFKEENQKTHKLKNPSNVDIKNEIAMWLRNQNRWKKVVQHARDDGRLEDAPRDIGVLMKDLYQDIENECADEIKEILWKWARKEVLRKAGAGFPEWYKDQLLEKVSDA